MSGVSGVQIVLEYIRISGIIFL